MQNYEKSTRKRSKTKSLKTPFIIVGSFIFISLISTLLVINSLNKKADNYIYEGISVNNVYIGNLSKKDAIEKLEIALNKPLKGKKISLIYATQNSTLTSKDINLRYDVETIAEEAFAYKKSSSMLKKFLDRIHLKRNPIDITKEFAFDEGKLDKYLKDLSNSINKEPKNATLSFNGSQFTVTKDIKGVQVKTDELKQLVLKSINQGNNDDIVIPTKTLEAKQKYVDLIKVQDKVSTFSTTLSNPNDYNRTQNITVAAKSLNGALIMPGETFSTNKRLGPRTYATGYRDAIIFENKKPVPGLAGGICQLVSTLYNTVLYSDLQVVERTPHSNVVSYVKLGLDATIAGDYIDFKFKNNKDYPIYIESYVKGKDVVVNFYGQKENDGKEIKLYNTQYYKDGKCYAEGYKEIYQNEKLISKKRLSKDVYVAN